VQRGPATAAALAALLAVGGARTAEARFPAQLVVSCAPKLKCTDRAKSLHRVQIGVSYGLQLPIGEPLTASRRQRKAIERALRFRTREIRPRETEQVLAWIEVALAASSPVGAFVGTRKLQLEKVEKRLEPVPCTLELTVCSDARLATLGVSPARRAKLCARALRRLRRRVGIIGVTTPAVAFAVDTCPAPKPRRTTTTTSSSSSTTSSTSTTSTSVP
jgi:hypothetical protein